MTATQYTERARQLVNLVNNRRAQLGRLPLREAHIMRAVRLVLGVEPEIPWNTFGMPSQPFPKDGPIPFTITRAGLDWLIANQAAE